MLLSAVHIAGSVCEGSVYDPWNFTLAEGYGAVADDLKKAYDVVVVRRKDTGDTSEKWFGVTSVESVVGEFFGQQGVRISNNVEVGEVECLPQSVPTPQIPSTSYSAKNPAKGNRKKNETPAPVAIKLRFEFEDESDVLLKGRGVHFDQPNFAIALKDQDKNTNSHRSGLNRRAAPIFQSNPRKLYISKSSCNCILVFRVISYLYIARCHFTELSST